MTSSGVVKNLDLAFEVARQALADPEIADELDRYALVILLDPADAEMRQMNEGIAARLNGADPPVVSLEVNRSMTLQPR